MPLFDYYCLDCDLEIEVYKTKDREVFCSTCGYEMRQLVCKSNFILNGKGWAKDGYSKCNTEAGSTSQPKYPSSES